MSLRALPLIAIPLILYNVLVMFSGGAADRFFRTPLFTMQMIKGAQWAFTRGDLIIFVTMLFLFAELVKATYTSSISLVDHGLSMLVFIACIVEFLVVNAAHVGVLLHPGRRADRRGRRLHDRHSRRPPRPDDRRRTDAAASRPTTTSRPLCARGALARSLELPRLMPQRQSRRLALCCRRKASRASTGWWRAAP